MCTLPELWQSARPFLSPLRGSVYFCLTQTLGLTPQANYLSPLRGSAFSKGFKKFQTKLDDALWLFDDYRMAGALDNFEARPSDRL